MLLNRRLLMSCATALALLIGSSSAIAATRAAHPTRISGVIVSINAARHTLKLRLTHATKHHKAGKAARVASAGGGRAIVVAFGQATVKGPDGAVAVGDNVTVTTTGPVGQTAVASSIDVIGQPNGGAAGKGAAVPGEVTAVDPTNGTLTLTVSATDAQGQSQDSSVIVNVSATTIVAVGDINGDGKITLADVSVGDHVVVFTLDASANPLDAIGILDASHSGRDHHGAGDASHGEPTAIAGTVHSVDTAGPSLMLTVTDGTLAGHTITVDLGQHTSFGGEDTGHDGPVNLSDISVGDAVTVYTRDATTTPIVAVGVVDNTNAGTDGSSDHSGDGGNSSNPLPASTTDAVLRFGGLVTQVRGDGLTVNVTSGGPLSGHLVVVRVAAGTSLEGAMGTGGGPESLSNIAVGDAVEIFTHSESASPVVAVDVRDDRASAGT